MHECRLRRPPDRRQGSVSTVAAALPAPVANLALETAPVRGKLTEAGFIEEASRLRVEHGPSRVLLAELAHRYGTMAIAARRAPMRSARKHCVRLRASAESAVVDAFTDLYLAWRERAGGLDVVYRRWGCAATATEHRSAFAAFSRALDDEGRAARRFAEFER